MKLKDFVQKFWIDLGLEGQIPEKKKAEGSFLIPVNERLEIRISELSQSYWVCIRIAPCPPEDASGSLEGFFSDALHANLFGQGCYGGLLSLDPQENFLELSKELSKDQSYLQLYEDIEDLSNYAELWQDEIAQLSMSK